MSLAKRNIRRVKGLEAQWRRVRVPENSKILLRILTDGSFALIAQYVWPKITLLNSIFRV